VAQGGLRAAVTPSPDPQRLLRRLLPTLIVISMIGPLALNILQPSLPGLAASLNASRQEVQLTLSLFLAAQAVSQLFIGGLADRFGRRPVLLCALALYVAASIAATFATSILLLIAARILQAFGSTAGLTISRTVVRDLSPQATAASMIGYVTMGMVVAPLIAPALGGFIDDTFGWRAIFLVCAALGVIAAAASFWQLQETRPAAITGQTTAQMLARSRELIGNRRFMGYALGASYTSAVFFTFLGGAPYLVIDAMGMPKTAYGLWFIALSGGYMVGNFCSGRLSQAYGIDKMIRIGNALGTFGVAILLALALVPVMHPAAIFLPSVFMSLGNGFLLPNAVAGAVSVDPKAAGAAAGVTGFMQMGMGAVGSYVAGLVTGGSPLPMAALMFAFCVAGWWVLERVRTR
jgi:DHA1 family bicyclomycin/chloramphenicol resistance-like MFS transporter